jgi:hypothetical protein
MATVTPNFNWPVPTSTDLVKDGATAIEALGDSIDGSLVDLKGGTTGQVLSKTSGTDMDFTWVTTDDANAIQNSIVDAKGDLIAASANDTPARLAVGNNGETLVADSSATTGLRWQGDYAAGKNKIINGDFGIWQRGTSFTTGNLAYVYTADRWLTYFYGSNTASVTQQTFTPGTAPVAGYEGQFFGRFNSSSTANFFSYRVEDVRTLAGQTATFSFWAKSNASQTATTSVSQNFGSGGSATVAGVISGSPALTTSWQRFSYTAAIPSISGKTVGTSSYVLIEFVGAINNAIDIWGVQLEAGSVATAFQTATGTIQGELAACQRYYWRTTSDGTTATALGQFGLASSTTSATAPLKCPVTMRVKPSSVDFANLAILDVVGSRINVSAVTLDNPSPDIAAVLLTSSGLTSLRSYILYNQSAATGFIGFSAEL